LVPRLPKTKIASNVLIDIGHGMANATDVNGLSRALGFAQVFRKSEALATFPLLWTSKAHRGGLAVFLAIDSARSGLSRSRLCRALLHSSLRSSQRGRPHRREARGGIPRIEASVVRSTSSMRVVWIRRKCSMRSTVPSPVAAVRENRPMHWRTRSLTLSAITCVYQARTQLGVIKRYNEVVEKLRPI
jgi:hypothetical protein